MALGLLGQTQPKGTGWTLEHLVGACGPGLREDQDGLGMDSKQCLWQ